MINRNLNEKIKSLNLKCTKKKRKKRKKRERTNRSLYMCFKGDLLFLIKLQVTVTN